MALEHLVTDVQIGVAVVPVSHDQVGGTGRNIEDVVEVIASSTSDPGDGHPVLELDRRRRRRRRRRVAGQLIERWQRLRRPEASIR